MKPPSNLPGQVGESDTSEPSNLATTLERTRPQTTRDAPTHDAHGARATRGAAEVTTMPTIPDKCTAPFLASEEAKIGEKRVLFEVFGEGLLEAKVDVPNLETVEGC